MPEVDEYVGRVYLVFAYRGWAPRGAGSDEPLAFGKPKIGRDVAFWMGGTAIDPDDLVTVLRYELREQDFLATVGKDDDLAHWDGTIVWAYLHDDFEPGEQLVWTREMRRLENGVGTPRPIAQRLHEMATDCVMDLSGQDVGGHSSTGAEKSRMKIEKGHGQEEGSTSELEEEELELCQADWEHVSSCEERVGEATGNADLPSVLTVLSEDLAYWATNLKRYMFQLFEGYEGESSLPVQAGFLPFGLGRRIVGACEAYDMLEFHRGTDYANAFARRIDSLFEARHEFLALVASFEGTVDTKGYGEFQASVDSARHDLKCRALSLAEHINLLRSQIESSKASPTRTPMVVASNTVEEERCAPMPKAEIARRLLNRQNARTRDAEKMMAEYGLKAMGNKWTIRLNGLDANARRRLEAREWP